MSTATRVVREVQCVQTILFSRRVSTLFLHAILVERVSIVMDIVEQQWYRLLYPLYCTHCGSSGLVTMSIAMNRNAIVATLLSDDRITTTSRTRQQTRNLLCHELDEDLCQLLRTHWNVAGEYCPQLVFYLIVTHRAVCIV